jgi:hypothetical protein
MLSDRTTVHEGKMKRSTAVTESKMEGFLEYTGRKHVSNSLSKPSEFQGILNIQPFQKFN